MKNLRNLAILALGMSLSACAVVDPGHRAVKVSLGHMEKETVKPGLTFFNPGIDSLHDFSVKQEAIDGEAAPLTADQQPITLKYKVLFKVPEGKVTTLFEQYAGDPYEKLVSPRVHEAFRQIISQYKSNEVTQKVDSIKDQILTMVRGDVKDLVDVVDIPIVDVDLPPGLQKAIDIKQGKEQEALQQAYELQKAKKQAEIVLAGAKAEAEAIKLKADALNKSPQLIRLEAVKKWDGKFPHIMSGAGLNMFIKDE